MPIYRFGDMAIDPVELPWRAEVFADRIIDPQKFPWGYGPAPIPPDPTDELIMMMEILTQIDTEAFVSQGVSYMTFMPTDDADTALIAETPTTAEDEGTVTFAMPEISITTTVDE